MQGTSANVLLKRGNFYATLWMVPEVYIKTHIHIVSYCFILFHIKRPVGMEETMVTRTQS